MSEFGNIIGSVAGSQQQAAQQGVVGSIDSDPEQAANAISLAKASGVPAEVIHANPEAFERNYKTALAASIVQRNPHLQTYVNSNPMAAKVSNDDYGTLDNVSQATTKLVSKDTILSKAIEGWHEGYGEGPVGGWRYQTPEALKRAVDNPISSVISDAAYQLTPAYGIEQTMRAIPGFVTGAAYAAGQAYTNVTGDDRGQHYAEQFAQAAMDPGLVASLSGIGVPNPIGVLKFNRLSKLKPYVEAKTIPPFGVDELVDQAHVKQSKIDLDNLKDALAEAQKSTTRERDPELFANFIRQHTDATIGIDSEAVRKIYGDSVPMPDDGLLGWVPGIEDQLVGTQSGGDIRVPLADWLAKVDSDVAKELHDDTRVRGNGLTLNETKDTLRLEPLMTLADQDADEVLYHGTSKDFDFKKFRDQARGTWFTTDPAEASQYALENESMGFDTSKFPVMERTNTASRVIPMKHSFEKTMEVTELPKELQVENYKKAQGEYFNKLRAEGYDSFRIKQENGHSVFVSLDNSKLRPAYADLQSIRQSAGLEPLFDRVADIAPTTLPDQAIDIGAGWHVVPNETLTEHQQGLVEATNKVFEKMAPRLLGEVPGLPKGVRDVAEIRKPSGGKAHGVFSSYTDRLPFILWSTEGPDPVGVVRHEIIHHLRQSGFFSPEEWTTLKQAVQSEDWIKKYNIEDRYAGAGAGNQLEEAVAEGFSDWHRNNYNEATNTWEKPKTPVDKILMKVSRLYAGLKSAIKDYFGYKPDFNDLFHRIESGEIGSRRGVEPVDPRAFKSPMADVPREPELPGMTRIEDRELFEKASAIGMTVKQYKQVQELIAKRDLEDTEFAKRQNAKMVEKQQTLEWKEHTKKLRQEIGPDFRNRPDVAADAFLREGVLYGEKIKGRPRLDSLKLTDEQKAALPPDYHTPGGLHPDDAARLFGYPDGASLVDRVSTLVRDRGELGPREHVNKLIEAEVQRRMRVEHGDLAKNILEETQDHVISQTQFDLLHEQTLAMATLAGKEMSLSKDDVKSMVRQQFGKLLMDGQAVETHLRDSLKAANLAERAYADQDFAEAFRQQQKQYFSMLMAGEAKTLAKAQKKFDRNMKLMTKREVPSVLQEYTNFVHDIMLKIGYGVQRSVQDLQEQIGRSGFKDLEDFWDAKTNPTLPDPREMPIADFLMDPKYKKNTNAMSVDEWRAVHDSITSMIHNGRDEKKIIKAGEKADLDQVKKDLIEQLSTLPEKEIKLNIPLSQKITKPFRVLGARLLQLEALFNRWDRGDPKGIFNSVFSYPASSAGNEYASLTRKYSKEVLRLKDFDEDLNKAIPNSLFIEPNSIGSKGGEYPMAMTRKNLRAVMLNVGNASNLDKLARGYGLKPEQVMAWVHTVADKSDWDFAQAVGDVWGKIFGDAGKMIESLSGLPPEKLPLEKIQTKFGEYDGWYHKIDYDPTRPGTSKTLIGRNPEEQLNYARATTPRSWEKQRTGYAAPINLQLDNLPRLMGQVLRDIAFRPFIHEASKIFYDKDFRMAVNRHYGEEYTSLLVPYLQDLGSQRNVNTKLGSTVDKWIEFSRQNAISTLIGMNPHTVYKHGFSAAVNSLAEVGVGNFAREFQGLLSADPITGQKNWDFAMQKSEELQRRHQQWVDTLGGAHEEAIEQGGGAYTQARSKMIRWGAAPVAFFDLLSAVPTFLAEYRTQIGAGETEGTAIDLGNRAVRRAHGSTAITSRPEAMRGGALGRTLTSLYGFFNQMLQRQYEIGWRSKDAIGAFKEGDYQAGKEHIPKIALLLVSSVIAPAVVEEMVSGHFNEKKEGWIERAGKAVLGELSSSLPVVRDVVHSLINRQDPSVGLINTPFKEMKNLGMDISKGRDAFNTQHAGDTAKHFTTTFGMLTGLANSEMGKFLKFTIDTKTGHQRPKGPMDLYRGVTTGNVKEPK